MFEFERNIVLKNITLPINCHTLSTEIILLKSTRGIDGELDPVEQNLGNSRIIILEIEPNIFHQSHENHM